MADNVTLNTMTGGDVVAADDCAAAGKAQIVKLAIATDGSATLIPAEATNGLDVDVTRVQGTVTVGSHDVTNAGTFAVQAVLGAGSANVGDVDVLTIAAGDNNIGNVDIVTLPDVVATGKAADGAAVSGNPVLIAGQDGTLVQSIKTDASGELQVDVLTLPSVTIGTNAALVAGSANIGDVDVLTMPDVVAVGKAADGAAVSGNPVLIAGQDGTNVQSLKTDTSGELQVDVLTLPSVTIGTNAALVAGSANIGDVDVLTVPADPFGVNADAASATGSISAKLRFIAATGIPITGTVNTAASPATSGGLTTFHLIGAATTNATVVKASAGQLFGWYIYNANAAMRKVAFHNSASSPTAGASIYFTLTIPPGSAANVEMTNGIAFSAGIAITTVTEFADNGTTAIAATDLNINLWYK